MLPFLSRLCNWILVYCVCFAIIYFFISVLNIMNDDMPLLDGSDANTVTLFSFSNWLTQGFWLALAYKWHLSFAAFIVVCLQSILLVSAAKLFQTYESDPYLLTMGCLFASMGLLFYPVITIGFIALIQQMDTQSFKSNQLFKLLFCGFGASFYRLLTLGSFVLLAHIVFALMMAALVGVTQSMALNANTDVTSDAFIQYQTVTLFLGFVTVYPFVIASFIFSPFLIAFEPDTSVLNAMYKSWRWVTSHFLSLGLFIVFALFCFAFFVISLSIIPAIAAGMLSLLPWENKFAVLQTLMILPLSVALAGLCFCVAWMYCALFQAYKALLTSTN